MARDTIYSLYSTGRVDPTFSNIWAFKDRSERERFLASKNPVYLFNNKYWRVGNTIKIPYSYEDSFNFDYVKITNDNSTEKKRDYYAFIVGRAYLSKNATILTLALDYVQTWYFSKAIDGGDFPFWRVPGFVVKETAGSESIPRRGTPSDYPVPEAECEYIVTPYQLYVPVVYSTIDVQHYVDSGEWRYTTGTVDGIYMAALPYVVRESSGSSVLNGIINAFNENGFTDAITGIYIVPTAYFNNIPIGVTRISDAETDYASPQTITISRPENCGGYVPNNPVLLGFDYSYFMISNGQGEVAQYHFEDFNGSAQFSIEVSLNSGSPVFLCYPKNYLFGKDNDAALRAQKVTSPVSCTYLNDSYKIWLAQTQNSRAAAINGAQLAISQAEEARSNSWAYSKREVFDPIATQLKQGVSNIGQSIDKMMGTTGSGTSGAWRDFGDPNGITNIYERQPGKIESVLNTITDLGTNYLINQFGIETAYIYDHNVATAEQQLDQLIAGYRDKARIPATATGSNAYGDLTVLNQYGFTFAVYTPTAAWAETLDKVLTASGQTVNEYTNIYTSKHTVFDYVMMNSPFIASDATVRPQYVRNMLVALLNQGVYLWHIKDGDISDHIGTPYGLNNPEG